MVDSSGNTDAAALNWAPSAGSAFAADGRGGAGGVQADQQSAL